WDSVCVQRGGARVVVGDPERTGGGASQAPRVLEIGIENDFAAIGVDRLSKVGDQILLGVVLREGYIRNYRKCHCSHEEQSRGLEQSIHESFLQFGFHTKHAPRDREDTTTQTGRGERSN